METRSDQTIIRDLLELVAALDRRVPMVGRKGEREIARDAQELRRMAVKRIADGVGPGDPCRTSGIDMRRADQIR